MRIYRPLPPGAQTITVNKYHQHDQLQRINGLAVMFLRDYDPKMGRHTQHFDRVKKSAVTLG